MDFVLDSSESVGTARVVLIILAGFLNYETLEAYPAEVTIARLANVDERTVRRAFTKLKQAGELEITSRASTYGTNVYRLPRYIEYRTTLSRDIPTSSLDIENTKDKKRSSEDDSARTGVSFPPASEWPAQLRQLCELFAELRSEERPEKIQFEYQDAVSPEWGYDMANLVSRVWSFPKAEQLIRYAFSSGRWPHLSRPRHLLEVVDEALQELGSEDSSA